MAIKRTFNGMPDGYPLWLEKTVTECRSCGMPILWGVTANDKRAPFDACPITGKAYIMHGNDKPTNHFATCPQRDQWRKPKS